MHTKEPLKYNIKIKIIKTSCFIVTCCLWVDFKNGLKFFILLKTDKYSTAKEHCGALGNAVGWFQCNLLEVSWDQHKTRIYKNWKWKLNWRLGTIVFCQDTHFCSSGSGHNFDIHIWKCKFLRQPFTWAESMRTTVRVEMTNLSVLLLVFPLATSISHSPCPGKVFLQNQAIFGFKIPFMNKDIKILSTCWLRCLSACLDLNLTVYLFIDRC